VGGVGTNRRKAALKNFLKGNGRAVESSNEDNRILAESAKISTFLEKSAII